MFEVMAFSAEYTYRILDRYSGPLKKITQQTRLFERQMREAKRGTEALTYGLKKMGDKSKAMMAAGEAAQRIRDMPKVADMVKRIADDAENILKEIPKKYIA